MSQFFSWQHAVRESNLESTTKLVCYTIGLRMAFDGSGCFPSYATIAEESGLSRSTVIDHIGRAARLGYLVKESRERPNGSATSNVYRPAWPQGGPGAGRGVVREPDQGSPAGGPGVVRELDPHNTPSEQTNEPSPQPPTGGVSWEEDSAFVQVIEAYAAISPDRTDREKAWEVWKEKDFGKDAAQILAAMPKFAESRKWQDGYAPNLSRWFREEAWRHVAKGLTPPDVLAERERINREGIAAHARIETDVRYGRSPLPADIATRDRWLELQGRPPQSRVDVGPAE